MSQKVLNRQMIPPEPFLSSTRKFAERPLKRARTDWFLQARIAIISKEKIQPFDTVAAEDGAVAQNPGIMCIVWISNQKIKESTTCIKDDLQLALEEWTLCILTDDASEDHVIVIQELVDV